MALCVFSMKFFVIAFLSRPHPAPKISSNNYQWATETCKKSAFCQPNIQFFGDENLGLPIGFNGCHWYFTDLPAGSSSSSAVRPRVDSDLQALQCPITKELMAEPVLALDGYTYERQSIEQHWANQLEGLQKWMRLRLFLRESFPKLKMVQFG